MVKKIITRSTFQTKAIYDEVLRQVYVTFGIEAFQKDQQKAIDMFFEGNDVSVSLPTGYGKSIIYQAAPVIDRLSLLEETGHYIHCAVSESSHRRPGSLYILMCLGEEDCPPSTFGLLGNDALKLLSKSFLFLAAILSTEERVALRLQRNYLLKKSLKTMRFCGK